MTEAAGSREQGTGNREQGTAGREQGTGNRKQGAVSRGGFAPFRLKPWFSERVWGRTDLRPWYGATGTDKPVGEAWLTGPESVVDTGAMAGRTLAEVAREFGPELLGGGLGTSAAGGLGTAESAEFPLLVKILFPSDKLSVQVHPDDAQAQAMGERRGKTECWYVLEAEPGAVVALGMKPEATPDRVRSAVADGTLESLMTMLPVRGGDMVFVDAGTVHAIGPGVTLLETQQTSDITFRMFDYGRPRDLHVEQGLAVMRSATRAGKVLARPMDGWTRLIEEQYFTVDRFDLPAGEVVAVAMPGPGCLVGLDGRADVLSDQGQIAMERGQAIVVPAGETVTVKSEAGVSFARCVAPPT